MEKSAFEGTQSFDGGAHLRGAHLQICFFWGGGHSFDFLDIETMFPNSLG